ncbi:hypothetical protein CR513_33155, partial [Mucuna pruriens]
MQSRAESNSANQSQKQIKVKTDPAHQVPNPDRVGQPKPRSTTKTFPPHAPPEELKPLPSHIKYAYLDDHQQLQVVIANSLHREQEEKLLQVIRHHKKAIRWKLSNLPRISHPSTCIEFYWRKKPDR